VAGTILHASFLGLSPKLSSFFKEIIALIVCVQDRIVAGVPGNGEDAKDR
jgi:hypothetical protein